MTMIRFRLHKVAADRDITKIKDVAEMTGVMPNTVSSIWNNRSRGIDFSTLDALCQALNCTPGDILEYLPNKPERHKR